MKYAQTPIKLGDVLGDECFQNGIYKHFNSYGTGTPILRINNFDNLGRLMPTTLSRVELSAAERQQFSVRENDILINRVNSLSHVGKSMLVPLLEENPVFESNMMRIRIGNGSQLVPEYVAAVLQAESTRRFLKKVAKAAIAQVSINQDDIRSVRLFLYPIEVQKRTASMLSAWDTAVDKTERLIAAKLRRNNALSNRSLFGHARFGERNTQKIRALHWFSAPSDWQVVEISKVAREVSALNSSDDGLPVLSCTKYDGLVDSLEYFDKQVFSHDTSKYKVVGRGQFAYATNHIEEGSIGYQDFVDAGLVSPIYTVFQSDPKKIDDGYFYKLLKTEKLRQIFSARTNSSVDRRGSLRWKDFARIHIPLPPLDEQREINAVLNVAKREIVLLQTEVKALKQQKRGLMQKLLTGQWRARLKSKEAAA